MCNIFAKVYAIVFDCFSYSLTHLVLFINNLQIKRASCCKPFKLQNITFLYMQGKFRSKCEILGEQAEPVSHLMTF